MLVLVDLRVICKVQDALNAHDEKELIENVEPTVYRALLCDLKEREGENLGAMDRTLLSLTSVIRAVDGSVGDLDWTC